MLDAARSILAYAHAIVAANVKRVGNDAIELPDPFGGLDPWRLVMKCRLYKGQPTMFLQLKPSRGAPCTGDVCFSKIETCLGIEYVALVRANLPRVVLPQRLDPRSFKETTTTTTTEDEEEAAAAVAVDVLDDATLREVVEHDAPVAPVEISTTKDEKWALARIAVQVRFAQAARKKRGFAVVKHALTVAAAPDTTSVWEDKVLAQLCGEVEHAFAKAAGSARRLCVAMKSMNFEDGDVTDQLTAPGAKVMLPARVCMLCARVCTVRARAHAPRHVWIT